MKNPIKWTAICLALTVLLIGDLQMTPTFRVGLFSDAHAVLGVRRRTARRTAVIVSSADAAAYSANAAAASTQQQAAEPPPAAAPAPAAGSLPLGTTVTTLPDGCSAEVIGDVQYQHCGADYYRAVFQSNNLVYVTTQP